MKQEKPLISIVIPAYNCEDTMKACLDSLLQLSYPNREIIIVDDGSTDGTHAILERYSGIRVIRTENSGPSHARNIGIREAKGDFIAFTDSDCIVEENWLEELRRGFHNESVAGVGGDQKSPADDTPFGKNVQRFMKAVGFVTDYIKTGKRLKKTNHNPTCNVLYRRSVLLESGLFDEKLWPGEDVEIDLKIERLGYTLYYNPEAVVYHYRPKTVQSFARMMNRYGWAQGYLVKRYGGFRALHFEPLGLLLLFLIMLFFAGAGCFIAIPVFLIAGLFLPYLFFLWKSRKPSRALIFTGLFIILLIEWNLGFGKGILFGGKR